MNASDSELNGRVVENERLSKYCGWAVFGGLAIEVVLTAVFRDHAYWFENWAPVFASALIALGVFGEIHFAGKVSRSEEEIRRRSDERVSAARALAATAQIETERLRNENLLLQERLAPRSLSPSQIEVLQSLKGKIAAISLASELDGEAFRFASRIASTLETVGIKVGMYDRAVGVHGWGNTVCVARESSSDSPLSDLLVMMFNASGIKISSTLPWLPNDVRERAPSDVPMILIGAKPWPELQAGAKPPR